MEDNLQTILEIKEKLVIEIKKAMFDQDKCFVCNENEVEIAIVRVTTNMEVDEDNQVLFETQQIALCKECSEDFTDFPDDAVIFYKEGVLSETEKKSSKEQIVQLMIHGNSCIKYPPPEKDWYNVNDKYDFNPKTGRFIRREDKFFGRGLDNLIAEIMKDQRT